MAYVTYKDNYLQMDNNGTADKRQQITLKQKDKRNITLSYNKNVLLLYIVKALFFKIQ